MSPSFTPTMRSRLSTADMRSDKTNPIPPTFKPTSPNNTAPAPPPGGAVRFTVGGPMGGGNAIIMPAGAVMNRDSLSPLVMTLGELNLGPDFTLTAEQKQKIQTIRDDFKAATEA